MNHLLIILFSFLSVLSLDAQRLGDAPDNELVSSTNYKTAAPVGQGDGHWIAPGTELTYTVFFENTGDEAALNVRVIDSLSVYLDPSTLRQESSSHDYNLTVTEDRIFRFSFPNIHLPSSKDDDIKSKGFVTFKVSPKPNLPDGTVLLNTAAIYFDFNAPIITDPVYHSINNELVLSSDRVLMDGAALHVLPNPVRQTAFFEIENMDFNTGRLQVFNTNGRLVREQTFRHPRFEFSSDKLPPGLYFYKIWIEGANAANGKLVVSK